MDVTRENFAASLDRVRAAISRSSFLALDCEFSGLTTGGSTNQYDSPEERYAHLRRTASGFLVIQLGLAAFTLEKEHNRYSQETFNFYLFPRHPSQGSFICQPSSLEFLLDNGFDFNRLIKDGIPYLRPAQVEELRGKLEKQLEQQLERREQQADSPPTAGAAGTAGTGAGASAADPPTPVPDNQAEFVDKAISEIKKFLDGSEEHLDFPKLSPFQRKLLYDHTPTRVDCRLELETVRVPGGQRALRVCRALSSEERRERGRRRLEQRVDEEAGFAQVIKAVSESGKPVVGHNMLLDLLHLIEQFICPLPETYADFKSVVHCVFPTLVDTKVMGSTQPFRDLLPATSLGEMVGCLATHPFSMPDVVSADDSRPEYGLKDTKHHEAGYDAYLTASCFAAMVSYLGLLLKPPQPMLDPTADIIRPFANKIFAMRMADLPYLNLTGEELTPSRDHVFHLTFPAAWRTNDIIQLFSPFCRVHIAWVDDTSAFVSLDRRDQASQVLQNVKATGMFTLSTYSVWQARQRASRVSRPTPEAVSPANSATGHPPAAVQPSPAQSTASGAGAETPRTPAATGKHTPQKESAAKTEKSPASGTATEPSRPSGKKRKRGSSDSSENGAEHPKITATKENTDLFAVPDW